MVTQQTGGDERSTATLQREDYCTPAVFAEEIVNVFRCGWQYVCHLDALPVGHRRTVVVGGESVIITRSGVDEFHAFANVCRHRGAQLCAVAADAAKGSIRCPYHSWTYALDGALLATPRVADGELDVDELGLWRHHVTVWNGLVFVSVADDPPPLDVWLSDHTPDISRIETLPIALLRVGARTVSTVAANWKILVENYAECLHCAVVHPELVELIPLYRTGHVVDAQRADGSVLLAPEATTLATGGRSALPNIPGSPDAPEYNGVAVFPNAFVDVTPTCIVLTALEPLDATTTTVVAEYLFVAAAVDQPGFDPSGEVDFNELVALQDYAVCEAVQRGVSSPSFAGGHLTGKDRYVAEFVATYRRAMGGSHAEHRVRDHSEHSEGTP